MLPKVLLHRSHPTSTVTCKQQRQQPTAVQNPAIPGKSQYHQLGTKAYGPTATRAFKKYCSGSIGRWSEPLRDLRLPLPSRSPDTRGQRDHPKSAPPNAPALCPQGLVVPIPPAGANSNKKQSARCSWGKWASPPRPMETERRVAPAPQPPRTPEAPSWDGRRLQVQKRHGARVSPQVSYVPSKVTIF